MCKVLRISITFIAVAIALCIFVVISKSGNAGAPILLRFAQDHLIALRGATLLLILVGGVFIFTKKRRIELTFISQIVTKSESECVRMWSSN